MELKKVIYKCLEDILKREQKPYAKLSEIYEEVAKYQKVANNYKLQSQIRGRLQENCEQYKNFNGQPLFKTEKIRSGNWAVVNTVKKFIRSENNTFLVSDDNWLTIQKVKTLDQDYVLEENKDLIYQIKLINLIGRKKALIIIEQLNKIRTLLRKVNKKDQTDNGYGISFEVFALATYYDISYEECINKYIVHGCLDGKIDAIYYKEEENIYVYQIKTTFIDDLSYNEMQKNYDMCINGKYLDNNKDLHNFIITNQNFLKGKKVNYITISNNSKRKTNILPSQIYEKYFQNRLLPVKNNNLVLIINKPRLDNSDDVNYNVSQAGSNFIFYIPADKLINSLIESLGIDKLHYDSQTIDISKYFSDNVRGVLTSNKKMMNTILYEPENFVKYNNGISITGEVKDLTNAIKIINPIINNGQQTITTILRLNTNLNKIIVPVKITNEINMMIKGKISQYSNDQVKVKAVDMLSLNPYIREIQEKILNNSYHDEEYFLKIYSSGKKSYYDILQRLFKMNNIIELSDFIKLYFSIKDKDNLGAWKNTFNNQVEKTVFNESFDLPTSLKVCETIKIYEDFLQTIENKKTKDDLKSADLAFKYLICHYNLNTNEAFTIIERINKTYYYDLKDEKSKLIDIYKSSTIINKLETEVKAFSKSKQCNKVNV